MTIINYPGDVPDPSEAYHEPELWPVVMVYCTIRIDHGRGWSNNLRVATPDGQNVIRSWGRAGGSLPAGQFKVLDDLALAYQLAARIEPFETRLLGRDFTVVDGPHHEVVQDRVPEVEG